MTAPTSVGIDPKTNELPAANDGGFIYTKLSSVGFESFGKRTGAEGFEPQSLRALHSLIQIRSTDRNTDGR